MTSSCWFAIESEAPQPLVVQSAEASGNVLRFYVVSKGGLGPVIRTSSGTLVSPRLAAAFSSLALDAFRALPASVAPPQSSSAAEPYLLIHPVLSIGLADLASPTATGHGLATLHEDPATLLVSGSLRTALEALAVPHIRFAEPLYAA
jgi:hypothetical protein